MKELKEYGTCTLWTEPVCSVNRDDIVRAYRNKN